MASNLQKNQILKIKKKTQQHRATISESESEVAQSCSTLCNLVDYSPLGSSVHGILQARILEWVAISFSRGSSWPRIEPRSPTLQADTLTSEPPGKPSNYFRQETKSTWQLNQVKKVEIKHNIRTTAKTLMVYEEETQEYIYLSFPVTQSCLFVTLWTVCGLPSFSVHGIL